MIGQTGNNGTKNVPLNNGTTKILKQFLENS